MDSPAYDAAKENVITFDLDKSRALLNQAGVTNLEFDLHMTAPPATWRWKSRPARVSKVCSWRAIPWSACGLVDRSSLGGS